VKNRSLPQVFHIRIWYLILETITPELGEMSKADQKDLMRDIGAIYKKNDSVLKSFMYEPEEKVEEEEYL